MGVIYYILSLLVIIGAVYILITSAKYNKKVNIIKFQYKYGTEDFEEVNYNDAIKALDSEKNKIVKTGKILAIIVALTIVSLIIDVIIS